MFGKRGEPLQAIVMNSADPNKRKEPSIEVTSPQFEPEIIPPDRNSMRGGGTARGSMRSSQRVYVWRPGLFTGILAILLIGSALVVVLAIFLGLVAIALPAIAALAIVVVVGRLLRNRYL
jgi:hypothetical protein